VSGAATLIERSRERVEAFLAGAVTDEPGEDAGRLREAMRYALVGGKRIRPALTFAAAEALGAQPETVVAGASAVEIVHAYSLVHDDLPAMDDDDERRGRPTVHVAFGEWNAILTGDALLTLAFDVLASADVSADRRIRAVASLARHAGVAGMVGGQAMDLELGQDVAGIETLERVHTLKTGALFAAAAEVGAVLAGATPEDAAAFRAWGGDFGVAFQHVDDALDHDQLALRETARDRVRTLAARCREFARKRGGDGAGLAALADWIEARARAAPERS
jgi:geranylgeranyl pyrophosphate synthase